MKTIAAAIKHYIKNLDKLLLCLCVAASAYGILLLMGIVHSGWTGRGKILVQVVATTGGVIGMLILSKIDYKVLAKLWKFYLPILYLLVIATLFFGSQRGGDQAWFVIPLGFSFDISIQPTEFLKVGFILTFAYHLSRVEEHVNAPLQTLLLCLHGAAPILLAHLQGDDGTAIIFVFIFLAMMFAAGISWKYILAAVVALAAGLPLVWFFLLTEDQKARVISVINPAMASKDDIYQQMLGELSLGSGQLWGKGIFYGKHQYIPEMQNDFIFSFMGEAVGFLGCMLAILLLLAICVRILGNGRRSQDALGRYICVGVFGMIASQIFVNLGMVLRVLPVIGVTLPFFSAGGSSVLALYAGVGLVMSVYMNQDRELLFSDD